MARDFDGSTQRLNNAAAVVTAYPFTLAAWVNTDLTGLQTILTQQATGGTASSGWQLRLSGTNQVIMRSGTQAATTSTTLGTGTWGHACGVCTSATARAAFLNGGGKGTSTANNTPSSIAATSLAQPDAMDTARLNGRLAEAAVWDVALSDQEVVILALGASPLLVRPQSLRAYWPLIGRYDPEIDLRGGFPLTLTASPATADHPRIVYPTRSLRKYASGVNNWSDTLTFTTGAAITPAGVRSATATLALITAAGIAPTATIAASELLALAAQAATVEGASSGVAAVLTLLATAAQAAGGTLVMTDVATLAAMAAVAYGEETAAAALGTFLPTFRRRRR